MQDLPTNQEPQQVVVGDYNERYRGYDEVTLTDSVAKLSDIVAHSTKHQANIESS